MYRAHFGLQAAPFSIAPNPHYLYLSPRHQEALAHLLYGIQGTGGFVLLTGAIGAGKTTLCRTLLSQLPEHCELAYIFNPQLNAQELLATICQEFGLNADRAATADASLQQLIDRLNRHLLQAHAQGKTCVLIIDEAQNLSLAVLEQLRLLTNLETAQKKLLQIILVGQPELNALLKRPELRQLNQRIVARFHLTALARHEIGHYIQHRLQLAGSQSNPFPAHLLPKIHRLTGGVPRLINLLCDRALLGAYAKGQQRVSAALLKQAARETALDGNTLLSRFKHRLPLLASVLLTLLLLIHYWHPDLLARHANGAGSTTLPAPPSASKMAAQTPGPSAIPDTAIPAPLSPTPPD